MDGHKTPTKTIQYLSPSGYSSCVMCGEDVKTKYAKPVDMINNLWVGPLEQSKKTKAAGAVLWYLFCFSEGLTNCL